MSVIQVECPGCRLPLKAADTMAGKKAKCKKCGTAFRIPGDTHSDSVADGHMLSTLDTPVVAPPEPKSTPKAPAALPKATPKPKAPAAAVLAADDLPPDDDLPPEDDAPEPAKPRTAESFAFDAGAELPAAKGRGGDSTVRKGKPAAAKPAGPRREKAAGGGMKWLVVAVIGVLVAAGAGVGGTLLFLNTQKPTEQAKAEDKKPDAPPPAAPTADDGKKAEATTKTKEGKKPPAGVAGKGAAPKAAGEKAAPGAARGMLALPPGRTITLEKSGDKPVPFQAPVTTLGVDAPFAAVRRVFPPAARESDPAVLWQAKAGFQGFGERLKLALYSPQTGKLVPGAGLEVDGDGAADPLCDLSADANLFAHAAGGKVTLWNTRNQTKTVDGFDPYADKPDHKAAKLAAVYLTHPPDRFVTVSTAGAVHVWDAAAKTLVGEYAPPKGVAGAVAAGKSVARTAGHVAVVVGGVMHLVTTTAPVTGTVGVDFEGDVGRSLALAVSPAGKVLYVFETDADGKKEKAVMQIGGGGKREFYRWPAEAGDPASAGWCGDAVAAVGTTTGAALLFEADGEAFRPLALAQTPGKLARHVAGETHWSLVPDPADPKRALCLGYTMPPDGLIDPLAATKKVFALTMTEKGLAK